MTARILIVDDMPANTRLLEAKLASEYYLVRSARDAFEALERARDWQPDLILLDVMMPGMDGYECCRQLKADAATLHIPVMMVTALNEAAERLRGLEAGADDFLTKPVDYDMLTMRVRSLTRLKRLLDEWRRRSDIARALYPHSPQIAIPTTRGASTLIVDNSYYSAQQIRNALAADDVSSSYACGEVEALNLTASISFDLIIINLSMTADEGLRLVSNFRAEDSTHETPLLLVGDLSNRERILQGFELGANDWLVQPVDAHELRARVRNQIRRKFYQDQLRSDLGLALKMALIDPLTGLYNQRYLNRHLYSLMEAPQPQQLAILMIDVDHFKEVNDRYGHATGDGALKQIAGALRSHIRLFDSVVRYGGEEFVVVMPAATPREAGIVAERLRRAVQELAFPIGIDRDLSLTVSIGIACDRIPQDSPEALLQAADAALYEAKRKGRNRVEIVLSCADGQTA